MPGEALLLKDATIERLSKVYGKSPAWVCLSFLLKQGIAVIPKASSLDRLASNFEALSTFHELKDEDVSILKRLERNYRYVPEYGMRNHPKYPFAPLDPSSKNKLSDFFK